MTQMRYLRAKIVSKRMMARERGYTAMEDGRVVHRPRWPCHSMALPRGSSDTSAIQTGGFAVWSATTSQSGSGHEVREDWCRECPGRCFSSQRSRSSSSESDDSGAGAKRSVQARPMVLARDREREREDEAGRKAQAAANQPTDISAATRTRCCSDRVACRGKLSGDGRSMV